MGRKSFKDKEREYLEKQNAKTDIKTEVRFVSQPSQIDKVYEWASEKYEVTYESGVLMFKADSREGFKKIRKEIEDKFGHIKFSMGCKFPNIEIINSPDSLATIKIGAKIYECR